jgi:hypothetical protein
MTSFLLPSNSSLHSRSLAGSSPIASNDAPLTPGLVGLVGLAQSQALSSLTP